MLTTMKPRGREPFLIDRFASERGVSYILRQRNNRLIRGSFHRNYLKRFAFRSSHLASPSDTSLPLQETIRKPTRRARLHLRPPKLPPEPSEPSRPGTFIDPVVQST